MTDLNSAFSPDWISPPGDTIADVLKERGWTQAELAKRLGYSEKHVSQLVNGKAPLTEDTAFRLESVLGSTAAFWLRREAFYRERLQRKHHARQCASWIAWLDVLPIKDLMNNGYIGKCRVDARNRPAIVEECLRFFGVASPEEWSEVYGGMQVNFRRTRSGQDNLGAITAWLRLGERMAEQWDGPRYDRARFEQALGEIRQLTVQEPQVFEPRMRQLLHAAGVTLVVVPAIPGARVSGVARWLSASRPLIQLSLYGKKNDRFWFTFFHEAAHVLLHGANAEERKAVFLDDINGDIGKNGKEHEANKWAADFLIPPEHARRLAESRTKAAVKAFARDLDIHPAIVVGRLQYEGIIKQSWMNDLKASFKIVPSA